MNSIALINGPNLNLLGKRQRALYGSISLEQIYSQIDKIAEKKGVKVLKIQSNCEGELINFCNEVYLNHLDKKISLKGVIVNAGGLSHTSVSLADALILFAEENVPIVEVHISNIFQRESFRHHSYISSIATGVISGLGHYSYYAAAEYLLKDYP